VHALALTWYPAPLGDGITYPVVAGCTEFTFTEEQLRQKAVCWIALLLMT
jgi:hypothetical protein